MYFDCKEQRAVDLYEIPEVKVEKFSLYNVILIDDDNHTYEYVIEMLQKIFDISKTTAYEMACEVDFTGKVIVYNANKEEAEFKRDQILRYGPDWRLKRSTGSMNAIVEIAE